MPNVAIAQSWVCASDLIIARLTIDSIYFGHTVPRLISIIDKKETEAVSGRPASSGYLRNASVVANMENSTKLWRSRSRD
jgi:hypothetical protein